MRTMEVARRDVKVQICGGHGAVVRWCSLHLRVDVSAGASWLLEEDGGAAAAADWWWPVAGEEMVAAAAMVMEGDGG